MENEKENIVLNDRRAITIHSYSWGLETPDGFLINDKKISIYYLPKNSYKYYDSDSSVNYNSIKEGGYIIEAQIKIVRNSKIKFITKEYFDKIYNGFENINFKALKKEEHTGEDGSQLEVKMGMAEYNSRGLLFEPLKYIGKTKNISLWSPDKDRKRPEMSKLVKLIKTIKAKIEFDKWYYDNYNEWIKCIEEMDNWRYKFRIGTEKDLKLW